MSRSGCPRPAGRPSWPARPGGRDGRRGTRSDAAAPRPRGGPPGRGRGRPRRNAGPPSRAPRRRGSSGTGGAGSVHGLLLCAGPRDRGPWRPRLVMINDAEQERRDAPLIRPGAPRLRDPTAGGRRGNFLGGGCIRAARGPSLSVWPHGGPRNGQRRAGAATSGSGPPWRSGLVLRPRPDPPDPRDGEPATPVVTLSEGVSLDAQGHPRCGGRDPGEGRVPVLRGPPHRGPTTRRPAPGAGAGRRGAC